MIKEVVHDNVKFVKYFGLKISLCPNPRHQAYLAGMPAAPTDIKIYLIDDQAKNTFRVSTFKDSPRRCNKFLVFSDIVYLTVDWKAKSTTLHDASPLVQFSLKFRLWGTVTYLTYTVVQILNELWLTPKNLNLRAV